MLLSGGGMGQITNPYSTSKNNLSSAVLLLLETSLNCPTCTYKMIGVNGRLGR
nr:hypothetical protein Iba_chr10bCG4320 [Ipomoea batatas]